MLGRFYLSFALIPVLIAGYFFSGSESSDENDCSAAMKSLSITDPDNTVFNDVIFRLHRNGEPMPCGIQRSSAAAIQYALHVTKVCGKKDLDKYQVETFLTNFLEKEMPGHCASTDDESAPIGLFGYCDMGPDRMVAQADTKDLVPTRTGTKPCRMFTREGRRVYSLEHLARLAEDAKAVTCPDNDETCAAGPVINLYAVPAGRVFMFAASYIG
jgi:hypothetical protein